MSVTVSMPAREFVCMKSPAVGSGDPTCKYRFYVALQDVSPALLGWMTTNPREQNLASPVAKTIAASMREDHHQFHLRNRGILLSAKSVMADEMNGVSNGHFVHLEFEDHGLHGNIDGGHTLRLILKAQEEGAKLPEQYVEFEVITGLASALELAEARNTSVALDMRTMESMKGSYDVLKEIFADVTVDGDRFFDRVELKMNQMLEEKNSIDVRNLISILLMFNQDLFSTEDDFGLLDSHPIQMYGGKEAALKKFLALGGGDPEVRDRVIRNMAPILPDIVRLWDRVERELPLQHDRKYKAMRFATAKRAPVALFSNAPLPYNVPQSILFPVVAAFRALVQVGPDGSYAWATDPFEIWEAEKGRMAATVLDELKAFRGNPNNIVKNKTFWHCLYMGVAVELARVDVMRLGMDM